MVEGIDVSKFQGTVNWSSVANAGISFAMARASLGMSTTDPTFVANYQGIVKAGLVPAVYHVVAGDSTGAQQAANIKSQLDAAGFSKGVLVLDVEAWEATTDSTPAQVLAAVQYLCNWIKTTYNRTPVIYTGSYWRDTLAQPSSNYGAKLWLAAYVTDPTTYVPKAWGSWTFWQYTNSGTVAGVNGDVDRDKYSGTLRSLKSLAGWEWDELATQAEIQAVVHTEVAAAIAAVQDVKADVDSSASTVITAVGNAAADVKQDAATNVARVTNAVASSQQTVVSQLTALIETLDPTTAGDDVKALVTKLHRHLCLPCTADGK